MLLLLVFVMVAVVLFTSSRRTTTTTTNTTPSRSETVVETAVPPHSTTPSPNNKTRLSDILTSALERFDLVVESSRRLVERASRDNLDLYERVARFALLPHDPTEFTALVSTLRDKHLVALCNFMLMVVRDEPGRVVQWLALVDNDNKADDKTVVGYATSTAKVLTGKQNPVGDEFYVEFRLSEMNTLIRDRPNMLQELLFGIELATLRRRSSASFAVSGTKTMARYIVARCVRTALETCHSRLSALRLRPLALQSLFSLLATFPRMFSRDASNELRRFVDVLSRHVDETNAAITATSVPLVLDVRPFLAQYVASVDPTELSTLFDFSTDDTRLSMRDVVEREPRAHGAIHFRADYAATWSNTPPFASMRSRADDRSGRVYVNGSMLRDADKSVLTLYRDGNERLRYTCTVTVADRDCYEAMYTTDQVSFVVPRVTCNVTAVVDAVDGSLVRSCVLSGRPLRTRQATRRNWFAHVLHHLVDESVPYEPPQRWSFPEGLSRDKWATFVECRRLIEIASTAMQEVVDRWKAGKMRRTVTRRRVRAKQWAENNVSAVAKSELDDEAVAVDACTGIFTEDVALDPFERYVDHALSVYHRQVLDKVVRARKRSLFARAENLVSDDLPEPLTHAMIGAVLCGLSLLSNDAALVARSAEFRRLVSVLHEEHMHVDRKVRSLVEDDALLVPRSSAIVGESLCRTSVTLREWTPARLDGDRLSVLEPGSDSSSLLTVTSDPYRLNSVAQWSTVSVRVDRTDGAVVTISYRDAKEATLRTVVNDARQYLVLDAAVDVTSASTRPFHFVISDNDCTDRVPTVNDDLTGVLLSVGDLDVRTILKGWEVTVQGEIDDSLRAEVVRLR